MTHRDEARQVILGYWDRREDPPERHPDFRDGYRSAAWRKELATYRAKVADGSWAYLASVAERREAPQRHASSSGIREENSQFYREVWDAIAGEWGDSGLIPCEECRAAGVDRWLEYSAAHVSHNLSRGAHPTRDLRLNASNVTILCKPHHDLWEAGGPLRKRMRIFPAKKKIMAQLLQETYG